MKQDNKIERYVDTEEFKNKMTEKSGSNCGANNDANWVSFGSCAARRRSCRVYFARLDGGIGMVKRGSSAPSPISEGG